MIKISNIKMPVGYTYEELSKKAGEVLSDLFPEDSLPMPKIIRESIDSRVKADVHMVVTVSYDLDLPAVMLKNKKLRDKGISAYDPVIYRFPFAIDPGPLYKRPVIIGAGPAGYFAALTLSEAGFRPILLERGKKVNDRILDVSRFWEEGILSSESNTAFGEGGAGTFSDGKLYTGNKDKDGMLQYIRDTFVRFGADPSVSYAAKPHIGTDKLARIMPEMRKAIEAFGGEVRFSNRVDDIKKSASGEYEITVTDTAAGNEYMISAPAVIIAIGHSARDTYKMLGKSLKLEDKPFALGLRIEHKREDIDRAQYGDIVNKVDMPAADYKITYHSSSGRAVFSFCMCPGGFVVDSSSEEGLLSINGMSYSDRNGNNSNSAIVVSISPEDYAEGGAFGLIFQEELERRFYDLSGGRIPVQRFEDFKMNRPTTAFGAIKPEIKGSYSYANIREVLPDYISKAIIEAVEDASGRIKGFDDPDAVLSGIESRTSSPVRIVRDEGLNAAGFPGLFPAGEGAGYAGGISSSARDGIRCAEAAARYLANLQ